MSEQFLCTGCMKEIREPCNLHSIVCMPYTLSIIMSQYYCFAFRTTSNEVDFKFYSHVSRAKMRNILQRLTKRNFLFWPMNVVMSRNTKTRLPNYKLKPRSRVIPYFHTYLSKWKILFHACAEEGCFAFLHVARENKTWNPYSDVIVERVYWHPTDLSTKINQSEARSSTELN